MGNSKQIGVRTVLVVILGLLAGVARAGEDLAVVAVGKVDPALIGRAAGFLQSNLLVRVRVAEPVEAKAGSLAAEAGAAAKRRAPGDAYLVAFVLGPAAAAREPALLITNRVAAVNVRALLASDAELTGRRFDRTAMRAAGQLLGLAPCPNPYCALTDGTTITNFDQAARNFCPPCQGAAERAVKTAGLDRVRQDAPAGK